MPRFIEADLTVEHLGDFVRNEIYLKDARNMN